MDTDEKFSPQSSLRPQRKAYGNSFVRPSLRSLHLCGEKSFWFFLPCPTQLLILALFFLVVPAEIVFAESVDANIQAGIADYQQQKFDQAEINFSKAQKEQPDNPELNYNLANSHYKNGKYQEALKSYSHATAQKTPPDLKQKSLYNSGNALFRVGKLEESIATYKKVLEMNPKDMDAKFNLEFVREKLKQKDQQDQNQPQDGDSDDPQNQKPNPSSDNNSGDQRDNSAQQENQEPSPPEEPQQNLDPSSPNQEETNPSELAQGPENSISKDQAERWLSGLDEDLKKFSQKQAHKEGGKAPFSSRDW